MVVDVQLAGANECVRALSLLFRSQVSMSPATALDQLDTAELTWCWCDVSGVLDGQIGLLLHPRDIPSFCRVLSPSAAAESVLNEVVNIAASSALNGITKVVGGCGLRGLPMPPSITLGMQLKESAWQWVAPLLGLPVPCWLVMAGQPLSTALEQRP